MKNPDLWQTYFIREKIIKAIREFFYSKNFHEVETPLLVPSVIPESCLDVFGTYLVDRKGHKKKMYLTASPEASIKKLIVAGIGNCFEITKSFRNRETDGDLHNPEFTILEWYRVLATYKDVMVNCEDLFLYIYRGYKTSAFAKASTSVKTTADRSADKQNSKLNNHQIAYQSHKIDLTPPWERISVAEALQKYAGISFDEITQKSAAADNCVVFAIDKIAAIAKKKGYSVDKKDTWEEIFNQIFLNEVEPHLGTRGKPTFLYDYPKPLAGLAKTKKTDSRFVERFELYIGGLEIGDCYSELTDYTEQKKRFEKEVEKIKKYKKTPVEIDNDFLDAVKRGLPKCAGIAVGVDRIVMLFANTKSIKDVLFFPF